MSCSAGSTISRPGIRASDTRDDNDRKARGAGRRIAEQLAYVAHLRRERRGALVLEQPAELLQVRAAARGVDDHEVDVLERRDEAPREVLALVEPARVDGQRAAAALGRRDDLELRVGQLPERGRVALEPQRLTHAAPQHLVRLGGGQVTFEARRAGAERSRRAA